MTATASNRSQKCCGSRLYFPFGGLLTTAETERWIFYVRQWLMWPVSQFPGRAQQPSDCRYFLFLWQLGRRCACRPVHRTWRFCWLLPGSPLHLPLWQCRQCVILHKCLQDSDIPGHWLASGPWDQCAAVWTFPILQNQIRRFLCCRNLRPFTFIMVWNTN